MFCTSCGKQVDKDDLFCIYCGQVVSAEEPAQDINVENRQVIQNVNVESRPIVKEEKITTKFQEQFGNQVSRAQNELGKVKNKAEVMKEKVKLNNIINDVQGKKAKAFAELGLLTYEKIRTGQIGDYELIEASKSIIGFDYIIYDNSVKIEELEKSIRNITCDCGSVVNEESKFCTGCGKRVEIPVDTRVFTNCNKCEARIEANSRFCPCCGNRR